MTIDGWSPEDECAFVAYDPVVAERFFKGLDWVARRIHVNVAGTGQIPPGRALIVANHTFGWDVIFPMGAVWRELDRHVWALGEHAWWKVPFLRRLAAAVGTVDGTQENADRLLSADELVLVLPGGLREAVKPRELRYQLLWGHRYGFIETALRNRVPIVPLACVGSDDLFDFVGNAYRRGERLLRRSGIPIPIPRSPFPRRVHLSFTFGEPIMPTVGPDMASDEGAQHHMRREVEGALHELIETELARRSGIDLDKRTV